MGNYRLRVPGCPRTPWAAQPMAPVLKAGGTGGQMSPCHVAFVAQMGMSPFLRFLCCRKQWGSWFAPNHPAKAANPQSPAWRSRHGSKRGSIRDPGLLGGCSPRGEKPHLLANTFMRTANFGPRKEPASPSEGWERAAVIRGAAVVPAGAPGSIAAATEHEDDSSCSTAALPLPELLLGTDKLCATT